MELIPSYIELKARPLIRLVTLFDRISTQSQHRSSEPEERRPLGDVSDELAD